MPGLATYEKATGIILAAVCVLIIISQFGSISHISTAISPTDSGSSASGITGFFIDNGISIAGGIIVLIVIVSIIYSTEKDRKKKQRILAARDKA